ncbi:MarR family transcriptional regulator [Rhodococcus sp. IEGM 1379]|uniref:MarR family winged helix-turn-helix transcriptional regulator n=1 Tax=Rhodococcus sp. IEGM 1379 TaxID=3047086 RepID=UPI0024B6FD98|nr:MarR family transcriptional regulator [Rhodococcus sp. IEGM 1379]MDI9917602.1 MarR family transcriptional regulator [Rhodococcus sp. IEGM 1379]
MHSRERELTDVVMSVARTIRRRQISALEPFGLSPSQGRAIRVLARAGEPVRLGFLAERLRIVPRSATDVVDSLEAAGWVTRMPDPGDRRAVLLELTDDGIALAADIVKAQRRESSDVFDDLDDSEQSVLYQLLERVDAGHDQGRARDCPKSRA